MNGGAERGLDVLVVDDEWLARVALRSLLDEREDIVRIREAESVEAAAAALGDATDVIFLDVRLLDESGFDLFERVEVRVPVVFVTAYGDYAVQAFGVDAVDYLVKPVLREHRDRALQRVWREQRVRSQGPETGGRVSLRTGKDVFFARADEIRFVRADGDYSKVQLADGRSVRVKESLERWQARLPSSFARVHRSVLVNLDAAEGLVSRAGRWELRLRDVPAPLPVSRRLASALRRRLET